MTIKPPLPPPAPPPKYNEARPANWPSQASQAPMLTIYKNLKTAASQENHSQKSTFSQADVLNLAVSKINVVGSQKGRISL